MARPSPQERRKQILKQREAVERKAFDREEMQLLFRLGVQAKNSGDAPAADRYLKKVLSLDADHTGALNELAEIHEKAGHHAEALAYLRRLRKLIDDPIVLYNLGVIYREMKQPENAIESMREFLNAVKDLPEPKWTRLREAAEANCKLASKSQVKPAPAVVAPPPQAPKPENTTKIAAVQAPRVNVQVFPACSPDFANTGTIADYFLRRRWIELRQAQNFEDLVCLPSLQGVDTYSYQQETVRRVLRHFKGRALLADEVGLGKTIEACLILKEYWMRGLVRKALILTPPSLVSQWRGELLEKFGMTSVSPDTAEFRRAPAQFWKQEPLVVASIAMARLDAHAPAIAATPWDMVIVDEAHCLKNRNSANWQLVDSLQKKFVLMLTATPVENSLIELYNLITLLKPGLLATEAGFRKSYVTTGKPRAPKNPEHLRALLSDVMIRNTRAAADVQLPRRIAATVAVEPTPREAQIYDSVSRFVAGRYDTPSQRMALNVMQRQAGSSPQALGRSVAKALAQETWIEARDRRQLEAILDLAAGLEESSKGTQLARILAAHTGKVVVFTEFIPTLDHLCRVCRQHGIEYALFSGDLSRAEKDAAIARFRDTAPVLLSTGAGGEGRNLQFADTVVNFDLPWNPMRIEQRVGRVHRIGQSRDVFVFNFCQQATVEEQLLSVLHNKINMFELVVGEMDAILGSLRSAMGKSRVNSCLNATQAGMPVPLLAGC